MEDIREPKRMNIRISADLHDWLERRSQETGIAKSSIIAFAVEDYRKTQDTVKNMPDLVTIMNSEEFRKKLESEQLFFKA